MKRRGFEPSVALANESLIRTGCKDGILPQAGNDGRVTSGQERSRAPPATARRAPGGGSSPVSAAISEDFPLSSPDSSPKARQVRGVEGGRITFEIAPDRALGIEIAGKMKAWGKGPDRTDEPAGKVSPSDEHTRFQDRVRTQTVTLGKSTVCCIYAFGYRFQWTTDSIKHIPVDWAGP